MARAVDGNEVIFVLKTLAVPADCRRREDPRFVEAFAPDELDAYIREHPRCTLFETLRDEEAYSVVRVFFDVDLGAPLPAHELLPAFDGFIRALSRFVANFAVDECAAPASRAALARALRADFSLTRSTNPGKTSFHLVFRNLYTTLDTLVAMKRPLLALARRADNPLLRALDPAVFRRGASLRVVGTRKTPDSPHVHARTPPHTRIQDYLFTFVDFSEKSCYFSLRPRRDAPEPIAWDHQQLVPFADAMRKVCQVLGNEILNLHEFTEDNFTTTPLLLDYVTPCALCRKSAHKHPHHLALGNGALRIFKSGNPHSCRLKVIPLEGNRLFTIAQRILDANVINLTERGDYIVWLRNCWRFSGEESVITKLVLHMRDELAPEFALPLLCPRNRRVIEHNLRDMLVDAVETDVFPEKLPFADGVLDIADGSFHTGADAKDFMCTVSTGYRLERDARARDALAPARAELERVLDDIQPRSPGNAENRALYEKVLASCLCGATKPCIFFFFGETATGKSTTKKLLQSALHGLFLETGQTILTDLMDKGPNPFLANMHLKRAVFCSELPDFSCSGAKKIRADNVKRLTEPCLVGRPCYSNRINNRNHATIIIDTNYRPVFDKVDNALMRRVGLVRFRTHFSNRGAPASRLYDTVKPLDAALDRKIQSHYFRFAFLELLLEWYQRHHAAALELEPTPDLIPDFCFQRRLDAVLLPSNSTHRRLMPQLAKLGYVLAGDDALGMPGALFQQRLAEHFNVRVFGQEIESFVQKNKKYVSVSEDYVEYIFVADLEKAKAETQ
ncbi:TPA_asm: MC094R [Molluscum contagiosum virus]|nr:TPA_asm: MC094R [Molluscum contagiosum virus]DBA38069.1 TPA_asm: MC094R [Molluscum contagiosum virus]DBA38248.1 TPA_asm: MC094R [Molluscum contagiosum virus]DBA39147.1 TPA_asm: MC094R [Molluscum contagiosum virus]DBA39326.1 TPA_asm: MC094R [Molluscum contagiosum virus]